MQQPEFVRRVANILDYFEPRCALAREELSTCSSIQDVWMFLQGKSHRLHVDPQKPWAWTKPLVGPFLWGYMAAGYEPARPHGIGFLPGELALLFHRPVGGGSLWITEEQAFRLYLGTSGFRENRSISILGERALALEVAADGSIQELTVEPPLITGGSCILDMLEHLDRAMTGWIHEVLTAAPEPTIEAAHASWLLALMQ